MKQINWSSPTYKEVRNSGRGVAGEPRCALCGKRIKTGDGIIRGPRGAAAIHGSCRPEAPRG